MPGTPCATRGELDTPQKFVLCARDVLERRTRNLVAAGTVGLGKTHLCAALANHRLGQGYSVRWVGYSHLFEALHATYGRHASVTRAELVRQYGQPDLLVIDELGIVDMPQDGESFLFDILEERDQHQRQTLATTNMPGPDLRQRIGDRCRDRLKSGGLHYCYGSWESMRGKEDREGE